MGKPPPFETARDAQDTCLIVHADLSALHRDKSAWDVEQDCAEIQGLARAIHLNIAYTHSVKPKKILAGAFLGKGQRETIAELVERYEPDVLIFNGTLSPLQQRNLEKQWRVKVIDRTGLILEIFAERAQTREGRLQVELAMLEYQKSRLVRSWTHLERQRGGAGFMGGPGETQIEIDRRLISERITRLKQDIDKVKRTRDLGRKARERVPYPIVALVGYTNAGKSTLFNTLTDAKVMAKDLLFATLDPTMRRLTLPDGQDVILADTVGFIKDLPTQLVAAFRSTLEQVTYADVILHIIDVSQETHDEQRRNVISILGDLGIDYEEDPRIIEVLNKVDALPDNEAAHYPVGRLYGQNKIAISALQKTGMDNLLALIHRRCTHAAGLYKVTIPVADGQAAAWLYAHGQVIERTDGHKNISFQVRLDEANCGKFRQMFSYALEEE